MKILYRAAALLTLVVSCIAETAASGESLSSHQILPHNFTPLQVFKNTNLVRSINLDKGYVKESITVAIENISKEPQSEYYIPFDAATISRVGNLYVRDKDNAAKPSLKAEVVEFDAQR